jgi:quercetin dioxygenase-like cupin family protein
MQKGNKIRSGKRMKRLTMITIFLVLFASVSYAGFDNVPEQGKDMQILYGSESQKTFKGPEDWFSGEVQVDLLFPANETAHYSGAHVTFQPGARTAWHLLPAGQHMMVTSDIALTGTRDGKIVKFRSGETVWCPPRIDHWQGATPDTPMTHLVITGVLDGKNVFWKEKVTDEQYLGK